MLRIRCTLIALVVAGTAHAGVVLCAKARGDGSFSTTVKIRTGACRVNEQQLDPGPLGLQGPPGPAGTSPGIRCLSHCAAGYPTVGFSCGTTSAACTSPDGFRTTNAKWVDCMTDDALALSYCEYSECGAGPCPGEAIAPACAPTDGGVTWRIAYDGTPSCQVTATSPSCRIAGQNYLVSVIAAGSDVRLRLVADFPLCTVPVLLGPGDSPTDSAPIVTADTRFGASSRFNPGFSCNSAQGSFHGLSGTFTAIGTCP